MLVSVYGSLRMGFYNHPVIKEGTLVGIHRVDGYRMYSLGPYPFVCKGSGTILVETYDVTPDIYEGVEMLEGYPSYYDREKIETPFGSSELYVLSRSEYPEAQQIISGDWNDA